MLRQSIKMRGSPGPIKNPSLKKKSVKYSKLPEEVEDEKNQNLEEIDQMQNMIGSTAIPKPSST